MASSKTNIIDLDIEQLISWLEGYNVKPYHASQILKWLYKWQADSFDVMTDIKKEIRELLSLNFTIKRLEIIRTEISQDGTKKYLFKLKDGQFIESVLIPGKNRYTLCISSQVGCAQGCKFCLTAKQGFTRNLTKGEIVAQVRDILNDQIEPEHLTNIVFMGMGEPLANYRNVISAINTITDNQWGLAFASRKVTVSTAGIVSKLLSLGCDTKANLAVSLNATDNKTRSMLMPINRRYPIEKLLDACREYQLQPRRRITFEYILIKGINDFPEDANRLAELLEPIKAKINLIPFNEHEGCSFKRPTESAINDFREILLSNNYTVIIRHSKGQDISAACGQLRARQDSFLKKT
ncbi:MAG: 23S rRNA (adenine(2503)-C(2))-methyltransferase RlmN [Deltaproteobacteria bacterium]|nr:23S rRNA (adenine(2503)-C(2))-methyltransferase RlmN [Deltaproteobacteria bacterium]MBW2661660.1 23S rRNA (adenine(2503)-C(2))-methyltransferase RlmN [Deltaproteobacteria bacterium]